MFRNSYLCFAAFDESGQVFSQVYFLDTDCRWIMLHQDTLYLQLLFSAMALSQLHIAGISRYFVSSLIYLCCASSVCHAWLTPPSAFSVQVLATIGGIHLPKKSPFCTTTAFRLLRSGPFSVVMISSWVRLETYIRVKNSAQHPTLRSASIVTMTWFQLCSNVFGVCDEIGRPKPSFA